MVLDVLHEVELVHDDGHDADHPGVHGAHQPGVPAPLAGAAHHVVGGGEAEGLHLPPKGHPAMESSPTSSGAEAEVRKFSTVSRALTPALAMGSCRMKEGSVVGSLAIFHLGNR